MVRYVLLLWCLACRIGWAADPVKVVVYADDAYPPYSYVDRGELHGVYPAIFRKAFAKMSGYSVDIAPVPWKRGLKMLEQGEAFAMFPPYFRPDERPYIDYSQPVLTESVVLFCYKPSVAGKAVSHWPEDFYGFRIALNAGFELGGKAFRDAVSRGKIILEQAHGNGSNIRKLLLGRVDCYLNDRYSILAELSQIQHEGLFQTAPNASANIVEVALVSKEHSYLGYSRNGSFPFKDDFSRQFNKAIDEMERSGEIQRIVDAELRL